MRSLLFVFFLLSVFATAPALASVQGQDASSIYVNALDTMKSLTQPAYIAFATSVSSSGMGFTLDSDSKHETVFGIGFGRGFSHQTTWQTVYRAEDDRVVVTADKGERSHATSPLFNPTWYGAYDWLRYGLDGPPSAGVPQQSPSPTASIMPTPAVSKPSDRVLGLIQAIGVTNYRIDDRGSTSCPDGTPGHRLHLTAYRDPDTHPLTDVIVEESTNRFCMMHFNYGGKGVTSFTGGFELDFGDSGGFWVVKQGSATFFIRMFGIAAQKTVLTFTYPQMTYPAQIDPSAFSL
jgi:hypothetical protein